MDKSIQFRSWIVVLLFFACLGGLAYRLYLVQVDQHEEWALRGERERIRRVPLPARRGGIYDRNGEVLVLNEPVQHVVADRNLIENLRLCARGVAHAEGSSSKEVVQKYGEEEIRVRFVALIDAKLREILQADAPDLPGILEDRKKLVRIPLLKNLDHDKATELRAALREERLGGIRFEDGVQRFYPNPRYLSHVLGYANSDYVGQEGIEKSMNHVLSGVNGFREIEVAGDGAEIAAYRGREVPPRHGRNVHLSIDMGLQMIVERVLDRAVAQYSPEKVMMVFMDPFTGEVLAMGSRPDFNLATRTGARKNLAVSDRYEPGSTFKLITLSAAYDSKSVTERTLINCHNKYFAEGAVRIRDHSSYSMLTPPEIIKKSSNIGAYFLAKYTGAKRLYEYEKAFGFGSRTGIKLTAEASGFVIDPRSRHWSGSTLSRVAMGYSIDMSALQMTNAVCTIANGGQLFQPRIVRKITDEAGLTIEEFQPKVVRRVISEETAAMVRRAMLSVTRDGGTATRAAVEGFAVAGKTGTAQKTKEGGGYYSNRYIVSFTGFLPAEDPRLVGIVVVDDPTVKDGPTYGGTVAAPLFREVAQRAMRHFGIEPSIVRRKVSRIAPRTISAEYMPVTAP